eukprot:g10981.t1
MGYCVLNSKKVLPAGILPVSPSYTARKMICDWCFGLRLRLNDFAEYAATQADDDPLYLFDHLFGEYPATKSLLDEYQVPSVFGEDQRKLWVLFPPKTPAEKLRPESNELKELDSAAGWFLGWWQKAREEEWPKEFQPIERLGVVWVHPGIVCRATGSDGSAGDALWYLTQKAAVMLEA